jgi:hypothetical protein
MTAMMLKTMIDSQKPCLPDCLIASSLPPTPAAITWKLVNMSLL